MVVCPNKLTYGMISYTIAEAEFSLISLSLCSPKVIVAQLVKNLPAMWETWVQYLGWEDPLEKGMATHSSILAWRIPWTEEPGRVTKSRTRLSDFTQSCLYNLSHLWTKNVSCHFNKQRMLLPTSPVQPPLNSAP